MIVAAAVCPHPPLIVPELAAGAAEELAALRHECDRAVAWLADVAETVVLVGVDEGRRYGGFAPWGVDVPAVGRLLPGPVPLSLLIGWWWLARNAVPVPAEQVPVPAAASAAQCAAQGRQLADDPRRLGLLVLGDGSCRHGPAAPGYDDPRAPGYDDRVARALASVDTEELLRLDPQESTELGAAGRVAWQVLAGAVRANGGRWHGQLRYHDAPYGVGYLVATWQAAGETTGAAA